MRKAQKLALLALALCALTVVLTLAALIPDMIRKGQAQKRIEHAIQLAGGVVFYSPDPSSGIQRFVTPLIGPEYLSNIWSFMTFDLTDPAKLNRMLDEVRDLPSLTSLNVQADALDKAALEKITDLKALTDLNILGGKLPDLSPLARSTSLNDLFLQSNGVTPELLSQLAQIRGLTGLLPEPF